jgi:hypothetical protein
MGLFDNWSMENLGKNLNPVDSTLGSLWKGDTGKVGKDLMGAASQAVDFNKALMMGAINPLGTAYQGVKSATSDEGARARGKAPGENQAAEEAQAFANQQAAEAKAKADREAPYKGVGFLGALQNDMPGMFKKKEKPGQAIYGPSSGGF